MNYLEALLVLEARRKGRAQRSATFRHRRITKRPMGIIPWQLGAEPFTAAALAWGFGPKSFKLAVPGEPRNRELAFRALVQVAREFNPWFEKPGKERPQLVLLNRGALSLLGRLGRRLAYLPTTGRNRADRELVRFGLHLLFLRDHARYPGQQLVIVLTDLLASHWVTGLSDLEMQHVPALDAAIDPPKGETAHEAVNEAELIEVGPVPSETDDRPVEGFVSKFNAQRNRQTDEAAVSKLRRDIEAHYRRLVQRGWPLLWRCLDRERLLPKAPHVERRWTEDVKELNRHLHWVDTNAGHYRTRHTSKQAAHTLRNWEDAQKLLEAEEAIDDPLRMVPYLLQNQGLVGRIVRVDLDNREKGPKNMVRRPLITVEVDNAIDIPRGKELYWTKTPSAREYVVERVTAVGAKARVVLKHLTGSDCERPCVSQEVIFSVHHTRTPPPLSLPTAAPWTHRALKEPTDIEEPEARSYAG